MRSGRLDRRGTVAAGAAALVLAAGAAGYWSGSAAPSAADTRLKIVACGIASAPPALRLPADLLTRVADYAPLSIGPVVVPGLREPLQIRFVPVASEDQKRAVKSGGEVSVPVAVGERGRVPNSVTLKCRYGELATVAYDYGGERVEIAIARL